MNKKKDTKLTFLEKGNYKITLTAKGNVLIIFPETNEAIHCDSEWLLKLLSIGFYKKSKNKKEVA